MTEADAKSKATEELLRPPIPVEPAAPEAKPAEGS